MKNLLILGFSSLVGLCLLEFLVTLWFPGFNPAGKMTFYQTAEGFSLGPKNSTLRHWSSFGEFDVSVSINKYGFRDQKDLGKSKAEDIFMVGDSFSFGWGVEENQRFSNLLEVRLGVPVYNISIPGDFYDYGELINYAQKNGAPIKNLIIGVCMENDLVDYSAGPYDRYESSRLTEFEKIKKYLNMKSTAYNLIAYLSHQRNLLENGLKKIGVLDDLLVELSKHKYNDKILTGSAKKLLELAEPFDTRIIIIPSRTLWIGNNQKDAQLIHDEFLKKLRTSGARVLNLRPYFEEGGKPLQYFFKKDGHWNEKGHLKAAEAFLANYSN